MQLLLLSNSRSPDGSYLVHAVDAIRALAAGRTKALFLPFAGVGKVSWDEYTAKVQGALQATGLRLTGAHTVAAAAAGDYDVVLAGGGNTFNLLGECRRRGWLDALRPRVRGGVPFIGWSAGANLACPTICTTNDMPIVDPGGFDALGFIGFQINPHYTNALPPGHQGETRNDRIAEYLAANPSSHVLALPEGDWVEGDGARMTVRGPHPALWFATGADARELRNGAAVPA
jgi:dipeptidase E